MIATVRAYRTADGRVVHEGDPAAASLLVGVGQTVPDEYEAAYTALIEPAAKAEKPVADKAVHHAPANKSKPKK